MDLENAEPAPDTMVRRSLFARAGAAGLAGLAAALIVDRAALAAADERPNLPTPADEAVLAQVIAFENAASELYLARLSAGVPDELESVVSTMAENHQAYAQAIAGKTGLSAQDLNAPAIFDQFEADFTGSEADFFAAAHQLEQTAVATHTALLNDYESDDAIRITLSILVIEARHATVLADLLGVTDLDVLFGNTESALTLSGDDA